MPDVPPDSGKWEYEIFEWSLTVKRFSGLPLKHHLKSLGKDRWELVAVIHTNESTTHYLKRPVARTPDPPPDPGRDARQYAAQVLREEAERLENLSPAWGGAARELRDRAGDLDPPPDPEKAV